MRRRDLIQSLMATSLVSWIRPFLPRAATLAVEPGPNAAVVYRTAFAWAKTLPSDDRYRMRRYLTGSLNDPGVRTILKRAAPTLRALREGGGIAECRWDGEVTSTADLAKEHLDVVGIDAIRVACLSARRLASEGRGREALVDLFAGLTLAHRIGTGGVLFARLLECGGEVPVFQTIGFLLPSLGPATLDDLSRRLDLLPPPESASATIDPESRYVVGVLRGQVKDVGPRLGEEDWERIELGPSEVAALRRLVGDDRDALLAHLDATGPAFAELARRLDLPRGVYRASIEDFAESRRETDPIVASLADGNITGVRHMVDRMLALRSMTRAGIALVRGGEPEFRKVADPFGEGPFGLERRGDGYLIRSAMVEEGKPEVALAIGDVP